MNLQNEGTHILVPGNLCAISDEARCMDIYLPQIRCIVNGQQCPPMKDQAFRSKDANDITTLGKLLVKYFIFAISMKKLLLEEI